MKYTYYKIAFTFLFIMSFYLMFKLDSLFFSIAALVFAGCFIFTNLNQNDKIIKENKESLPDAIKKHNFIDDDQYLSDDYLKGLAINYGKQQVALFQRNNALEEFDFKQIPFSSIIESEIREDNVSMIKSSKGSIISGALVGGAIGGNVGAMIGGLSGTKKSSDKTHKLTLLLTIDDYQNPYFEINYINNPLGTPKISPLFNEARDKITKWHKTFTLMITKNKQNMNF